MPQWQWFSVISNYFDHKQCNYSLKLISKYISTSYLTHILLLFEEVFSLLMVINAAKSRPWNLSDLSVTKPIFCFVLLNFYLLRSINWYIGYLGRSMKDLLNKFKFLISVTTKVVRISHYRHICASLHWLTMLYLDQWSMSLEDQMYNRLSVTEPLL